MRGRTRKLLLSILALTTALIYYPAAANQWPHQTVRIVVPFPAGSAIDSAARILADGLSKRWERPVVIENRSGGETMGADRDPEARWQEGRAHAERHPAWRRPRVPRARQRDDQGRRAGVQVAGDVGKRHARDHHRSGPRRGDRPQLRRAHSSPHSAGADIVEAIVTRGASETLTLAVLSQAFPMEWKQ
jgi:hypothetical protein